MQCFSGFEDSLPSQKRTVLIFFGLVVIMMLILSAYSNTLNSPAVLDDTHSFIDEPLVQDFDWNLPAVVALSQSKFGWKRFIPMLTLAHDFRRGQGRLSAFHATNIFIHLLTTLAVFFWARLLLRLIRERWDNKETVDEVLAALAVAGIWSLVPVQTNAVTYIVQRMAALAALFYIISFTAYFYGRLNWLQNCPRKAASYWFIALVFFFVALLSKENSVTLPIMIIVTEELFFYRSFHAWLAAHKKTVSVLAILVLTLIIVVSYKMVPSILASYDRRHFTLGERLLTELRVVVSYISLLLFPWPSRLCLDHHVPLSSSLLMPLSTLFSFLLLLLFAGLSWFWRRRFPILTFGLSWFFLNLMLESSIVALELKFEHRLYLPSSGFYLFLVVGGVICGRFVGVVRDRRFWFASLVTLCAVLSLMTHVRNRDWVDAVRFYEDCETKAPLKPRVHSNLSKAYTAAGFYEKSIAEAEKAIELGVFGYEEYWVAACNITTAYNKQGRKEEAQRRGEVLLHEAPEDAKINAKPIFLRNLAMIYLNNGEYQKAYDVLYSAIDLLKQTDLPYLPAVEKSMLILLEKARLKSDDLTLEKLGFADREKSTVMMLMAKIFLELADFPRARKYAGYAVDIDADCVAGSDLIYKLDGFEKANTRQSLYGTLRENYVFQFWKSSFNFKMAVAYVIEKYHLPADRLAGKLLQQICQSNPGSPDSWLLNSWHYYRGQKYVKAIEMVNNGLQIDDDYAQLWVNLGMYQLAAKKPREALVSLLKALDLYPGYPRRAEVAAMITAAKKLNLYSK